MRDETYAKSVRGKQEKRIFCVRGQKEGGALAKKARYAKGAPGGSLMKWGWLGLLFGE